MKNVKEIPGREIQPQRSWREKTIYSTSKTIPGQSLIPADLMKRHLAGTLPDIDLSSKYEYHYDEEGNQVAEPLPLEMHELHKMAVAIRKRQFEEATKQRERDTAKFREQVIKEYEEQLQKAKTPAPTLPTEKLEPKPAPPKKPTK